MASSGESGWSKITGSVRRRKKLAVIVILVISLGSFLSGYEVWRSSVESQINGQIDFMNSSDYVCAYVISNSRVMNYFDETVIFTEGGKVNTTKLADWQDVLTSAATLRNYLLSSSQPCKMFFGLTRTYFILLGEQSQGPGLFTTVNLYFAKYAPF